MYIESGLYTGVATVQRSRLERPHSTLRMFRTSSDVDVHYLEEHGEPLLGGQDSLHGAVGGTQGVEEPQEVPQQALPHLNRVALISLHTKYRDATVRVS